MATIIIATTTSIFATLTQTVLLRINVAIFMAAAGLAGKLEREKEENRRKITSSIGGLDIIR